MKKNNGSLQLWLWTTTPLLFLVYAVFVANAWALGERATPFVPNPTTCVLTALLLISPFVRHHLFKNERDSMDAEALKRHRDAYNIGWFAVVIPLIVALISFVASPIFWYFLFRKE